MEVLPSVLMVPYNEWPRLRGRGKEKGEGKGEREGRGGGIPSTEK